MFSKKNILIISGTILVAYFLFRKRESKKEVSSNNKKVIPYAPIDIEPMPWVATPNYFPEVK